MIIPVRCFSCGSVLADKYRYFQDETRKRKIAKGQKLDVVVYLTEKHIEKTQPTAETPSSPPRINQCLLSSPYVNTRRHSIKKIKNIYRIYNNAKKGEKRKKK